MTRSFEVNENSVSEKNYGECKKYRDMKHVTTERRRNYLVSELNDHTTKSFTENLLAIEMKKTQKLMNKPVHIGLSILDLSETVTQNYGENAKLCYMDTLFISKKEMFTRILQKMLKKDLTLQILKQTDHYL